MRIIVNDRLDVALAIGADGVHVGVDDLPVEVVRAHVPEGFAIGASAHRLEEVLAAQEAGADYVGLGAFFATATKPGAVRLGSDQTDRLQDLAAGLTIPVLAIGGLTPERVPSVLRLPVVTGIAASGAIQKAENPDQVIRRFRRSIDRSWARRVVLVGILAVLSACRESPGGAVGSDAGQPASGSPARQPDRPLFGPSAVTVTERFRLRPETLDQAGLREPIDVAVDGAGNVYVLGGESPGTIVRFDDTGQLVRKFDQGETDASLSRVLMAQGFELTPWNTLLLVDRGKNAVMSFLTLGTFVSAAQVHGMGIDVEPLPEFGHFLLHKWDQTKRQSYVVHMRTPIDSVAVAYAATIPTGQSIHKEMRDIFFHTETDRLGRLYVGFSDGYPVRVVGPDGELLRFVSLDRQAVPKDREQLARERSEILARLRVEAPDLPLEVVEEAAMPDTLLPVIEELAVDLSLRLWVRTHRQGDGNATSYDVFNEAGGFLARVQVPGKVRATAFGPDGALYVVAEENDGLLGRTAVVAYDVRLGSTS